MTSRAAIVAMTLAVGALVSACAAGPTATNGAPGLVTHLTYRYLTDLGNGTMDRGYGTTCRSPGPVPLRH